MTGMADSAGSHNDGWVRAIRAEMGAQHVTQRDLAAKIGLHFGTVNGYLTENLAVRTVMTMDVIGAVADALGVDIVDLATSARSRRGRLIPPPRTSPASDADAHL